MSNFVNIAIETAIKAGVYTRRKLRKPGFIREKRGAADIVTEVDIETQKIIIEIIRKNFPDHEILAEEQKENKEFSFDGYVWAIDPIDGTSVFAAGLPTYSCSIALLKDKIPIVAAIYVAVLDQVVWALKGKGTYAENQISNIRYEKLKIRKKRSLNEATVGFDPAYFQRDKYINTIAALLIKKVRIMPMIWSQAASLSLIAFGIFDGYIQCGSPKIWDVAAGKLIVEEAGGVVTDFQGKDLDIFNINGYVAGNKYLHHQLLEYTRKAV